MIQIAKNYLNYSNIYISWNKNKNYISIISDSFSQIKISNSELVCQDTIMTGIEFDNNLEWRTKKYILKIKDESRFNPNDLKILNNISGRIIDKNRIHLNIIEE